MLGCLSNLVFHLELDKLGGADGLINLFEWLLGLANESESKLLATLTCDCDRLI